MATTGNILGTGVSALLAQQRALSTTGHNIANVNTDGYSRQRVDFTARTPQPSSVGFIGTGVQTSTITRVYDNFLTTQLRGNLSANGQAEVYYQYTRQIDNLLADPATGLAPVMQGFFNAVQDVANDPTSLAARQALLGQGESLINRFQSLESALTSLQSGSATHLQAVTGEINGLAQTIAKLNNDIAVYRGMAGGQPPNDLLDQRDAAIAKLSEYVSVSVTEQDDGMANVFIGSGQTLVLGARAGSLQVVPNGLNVEDLDITLSFGNSAVAITESLNGGTLGGLMAFRDQVLIPTRNELGRIATSLAMTVNAQHRSGMDLYDSLGGDFFAIGAPLVSTYNGNTGSGAVSVAVTDVGALTSSDYLLQFDGTDYLLTDLGTNTTQNLGAAGPFTVAGLTLTASGTPDPGDRFLIQPTRNAVAGMAQLVDDPRNIAAAAPVLASATAANTGNARITPGTVLDPTNAALLTPVSIDFVDAFNYQIDGAGPLIPYTSGVNLDINGWRVTITGTPAAGDSFSVGPNNGAAGDNRNALLLGGLQTRGVLDNGRTSLLASYGQLVSNIGTRTHTAELNQRAQASLLGQSQAAREAVSGVNLDEEAANMIRYQQAYQAAAQVIAIGQQLFDVLLGAVRR